MNKSALLVSTAIGLTLAVAGPAAALNKLQHPAKPKDPYRLQHLPGAPAKPQRNSTPPKAAGLKEQYIKNVWSSDTSTLVGGFAVISTGTTLPCKTACTIITDTVALEMSSYDGFSVTLCPTVDGYFTNLSCIFLGEVSGSGYHPVSQLTNVSVGPGTHTATFYVYSFGPAYLGPWQIDYHVYK